MEIDLNKITSDVRAALDALDAYDALDALDDALDAYVMNIKESRGE